MDLFITRVRPWARTPDTPACDITISDGVICAIRPHDPVNAQPPTGTEILDGGGGVIVPSLSDVHAHLDSTRLGLPFRPHTAGRTLESLVDNDLANWRSAEKDVTWRATHTLGTTIAAGATTITSHAQIDPQSKLDRFHGVLAAREHHQHRADVRIVAFPQAGVIRSPGTTALLAAALEEGADCIGGIDPCAFDRDPVAQLDCIFDLAERYDKDVDIHLHESGTLGAFSMELIAERTRALHMHGRVTISHAFALVTQPSPAQTQHLLEQLAEADIAVTTVAPPGRTIDLNRLRDFGIRVGVGQDGTRDYWSPYGDGDMLRRTWQLAFCSNYRADADIEHAYAVASVGGKQINNPRYFSAAALANRGITVGAPADLLILDAETVTSAVMDCPTGRIVIHRGTVVARDGSLVE
ncbi:amidohydrolase family protein [Corynebacterium choanae]|uniref:N-isopropylammelide isopropyl amidohydrolase n=1 Tax=Corynebacterium choanae TaxID=1862358 RepID=A0A3G6J8K3_9CORY|nr:amidohydrolase family protein [Corynebacterium choanae]AZA12780.1 N-isopropylammelide isopropyl amidohydrolase [Corynebacterium choanae]